MPRIGLLSDSHGRSSTTRRAVDMLMEHDVEMLLHLGDVGTVEVIDALVVPGRNGTGQLEARLVFGNTDWDRIALERYANELGIAVDDPVGKLQFTDADQTRSLVYCHGDHEQPMRSALDREVDYLCHGHTHRFTDIRRGATRVINPGALFRADQYTAAVLNTATDELTTVVL